MIEKKIRHILTDKEIGISTFAEMLNVTQPNLSQQLKRDNFRENDIKNMADLLDCEVDIVFRDRKTGKEY